MTRTRNMWAVFFTLTILGLPAWAGSIGLQFGSIGKVGNQGSHPLMGTIREVGMTFGNATIPAMSWFSFTTGKSSGLKPNEWLFGAGGQFKSYGCVDIDLDQGKCDKKDLYGTLFTGTFKSAELFQTGKNTFTLNGQVSVILSPVLA